jgi:hypothetical protein
VEVTEEESSEQRKGISLVDKMQEGLPSRGNVTCKGLEVKWVMGVWQPASILALQLSPSSKSRFCLHGQRY